MSEKWIVPGKLLSGEGYNVDEIGGQEYYGGWTERWGQEIIERVIRPRVKPDDKILDLGSGWGRTSMTFSMRDIEVMMVDLLLRMLEEGNMIRRKAGVKEAKILVRDIREINRNDLDGGVDVVVANDTLNHFGKNEANRMIKRLPKLLKPEKGGLIYVNGPATESSVFEYPEAFGVERIDERTLQLECYCTGEPRLELVPFFEEGELEARLALLGGRILGVGKITRENDSILHEVVAEFCPRKKR